MYGKIFESIYDGTLHGQWEAIVTMQQLIVLCTPDGIVDMTPQAIAARTSIPLKIIAKGLKILSEPDPHTRTPGEDGRRIVLMDDHRPWGWVLVNHNKYQHMQDADTVRAQTRERVRKHRELKRSVTDGNAQKRHSDSDSDLTPLPPLERGDVDNLQNHKGNGQWWLTNESILEKAKELGLNTRGESASALKAAIRAKLNE